MKPLGVIQELYALLIAHYAVRLTMHEAACLAAVDPDQLSFTHALQVIQEAIGVPDDGPGTPAQLYQRMLRDIATGHLPQRRLRSNPRVVKRKMSKFHLKRTEHYHWPQPTCSFREAVAVI